METAKQIINEFKKYRIETAARLKDSGLPIATVCKRLGIPVSRLYNERAAFLNKKTKKK